MANLETLIAGAQKLSRNPLGIIALFQVLVYAIAGLVTARVPLTDSKERMILVWFLVLFPAVVLIAFTYLVACHHQKLYAPSDFTDETNFMRSFDHGLASSPRFTELEEMTTQIRNEVESMPLFAFSRLPISAQGLLKRIYLSKDGLNFDKYLEENGKSDDRKKEYTDALAILTENLGWVEMRERTCILTEKGRADVSTFIELTIPRFI